MRASDKVEKLIASNRYKSTLVALASFADPDGTNCYPSHRALSQRHGLSSRTLQRHIKALIDRGELVCLYQSTGGRKSNCYYIPCCKLTSCEIEQQTCVSRRQLKLPLVSTDTAGTIPVGESDVLEVVAGLSPVELSMQHRQNDYGATSDCRTTQPVPTINQSLCLVLKTTKKMEAQKRSVRQQEEQNRTAQPICSDTEKMIRDTMERLKNVVEPQPTGSGTRLRQYFEGMAPLE